MAQLLEPFYQQLCSFRGCHTGRNNGGKVEASGEISCKVTTDPFPQPQVNMVNLNSAGTKRTEANNETGSGRERMVSKETNERPKATISVEWCCGKCKCEGRAREQCADTSETNSAEKGKEPEKPPRAEQAVFHSQKMLKTKSPDKLHVHLTSSSDKRLEASQVEGEPEPVPAREKREDWIEENEEERLDYEPSTDDQNALLGMEGRKTGREEYGEEQMEYD
ncbi:unnamed protein product, partial [Prunus brigantina]